MEIKILKDLKAFLDGHSPGNYSIILAFPIILLIFGFIIWNTYLYTFGFIEKDVLRSQFLMSGFFFLLLSLSLFSIVSLLKDLTFRLLKLISHLLNPLANLINRKILREKVSRKLIRDFLQVPSSLKVSFYICISFVWLIFYVVTIFPFVPTVIGGGQPRSLSLLASDSTMPILNSLGLLKAEGARYQTINVCIVNEDSQGVSILLNNRILRVDNSLYTGFASLGGVSAVNKQDCIFYAHNWSLQGLKFELLLFQTSLTNFILNLLGAQGTYKFFVQPE